MLTPIAEGWTVRAGAGPVPDALAGTLSTGVPASVPGVVHTDLLAAGLIPDPYLDDNEAALAWIGLTDWVYSTTFRAPRTESDGARLDLVAHGLDTVATVVLNGTEVARTKNQHRGYRWDVSELLRDPLRTDGDNLLEISFRSAVAFANEQERVLGERPHSNRHPYNAMRKSACNFGWDWGPDVVTAGIWKQIGIEVWSGVRLASVRPLTEVDGDRRAVRAEVALEWQHGARATTVTLTAAGREASLVVQPGTVSVTLLVETPGAQLWWPRGHGAQPLYEATVTAGDDAWAGRVGFRTVDVDVAPDADGSPFAVRVNGEPVYIRGANWIPDDTFLPRITRDSLSGSIGDAIDAGLNLLRVWGGGIYESEDFYALCDEQGVLVWQDFMLACAAYSEDEPLWSEIEAEAREAVTRIVAHPSLLLFNGGNESIWGFVDWDWRRRLGDRSWGERYYRELFPAIVGELAPGIPYSDNSPHSFSDHLHPNDSKHGTSHLWEVWNTLDYTAYRDSAPRFVSEFGFQGPPAWSTLFSVVHDEPPSPQGAHMLTHQKAADGNGKLERGLGEHLAVPASIDDWHWATQLNQARAVAFGVEHFRSHFPLNQGSTMWQLNDCWPVVSWAAVDSLGIRKPLWHAMRRVYADRLLTIQPRGDAHVLFAHNDSADAWSTVVSLQHVAIDGRVLSERTQEILVPARAIAGFVVSIAGDAVVATASTGERACIYKAEDPDLGLIADALSASAERSADGYLVTVEARALVKDVTLLADRVHAMARVDSALVTLLAGERHTFRVRLDAEVDPAEFIAPTALRSANDLSVTS